MNEVCVSFSEYAAQGSLYNFLQEHEPLELEFILNWAKQIALGNPTFFYKFHIFLSFTLNFSINCFLLIVLKNFCVSQQTLLFQSLNTVLNKSYSIIQRQQ